MDVFELQMYIKNHKYKYSMKNEPDNTISLLLTF